ncbi:MAG: BrnA antitoxin family protein [Candidatus Binataceae bacterium]
MKEKIIVVSEDELRTLRGETDWARVDALTDEEIEEAARSDPDAAPIADAEWFKNARLVMPERKVPVSIRIDREVVDWFKSHGRRYQTRINAVLRSYVQAHRKAASTDRKRDGQARARTAKSAGRWKKRS